MEWNLTCKVEVREAHRQEGGVRDMNRVERILHLRDGVSCRDSASWA